MFEFMYFLKYAKSKRQPTVMTCTAEFRIFVVVVSAVAVSVAGDTRRDAGQRPATDLTRLTRLHCSSVTQSDRSSHP